MVILNRRQQRERRVEAVLLTALVLLFSTITHSFAAPVSNQVSCAGAAGGWIESKGDGILFAAGQPGGVTVSTHPPSGLVNYAGFLGGYVLAPSVDTDKDGIVDELDLDNDDDGIDDLGEVGGTAFDPETPTNPNDPDTDGDGLTDLQEQQTGTDPTDDEMYLRFTDMREVSGGIELQWLARSNWVYDLYWEDDLGSSPAFTGLVEKIHVTSPGVGPWQVTTGVHQLGVSPPPPLPPTAHFRIEVTP